MNSSIKFCNEKNINMKIVEIVLRLLGKNFYILGQKYLFHFKEFSCFFFKFNYIKISIH